MSTLNPVLTLLQNGSVLAPQHHRVHEAADLLLGGLYLLADTTMCLYPTNQERAPPQLAASDPGQTAKRAQRCPGLTTWQHTTQLLLLLTAQLTTSKTAVVQARASDVGIQRGRPKVLTLQSIKTQGAGGACHLEISHKVTFMAIQTGKIQADDQLIIDIKEHDPLHEL